MPRTPQQLMDAIVALSQADSWEVARLEWSLESVFIEENGTCLCGHHPIVEHCVIRNRANGNETVVGNVCIRKFFGLPSERLFACFRRIAADIGCTLTHEAADYAFSRGWINDWEHSFCLNVHRRSLSHRQCDIVAQINRKVLFRLKTHRAQEA